MSDITKLANVVGAKTARACDGCLRKRARWFCAADDAFLCQFCDSRVHTANPVARRHERVRLKYALSLRSLPEGENESEPLPRPTRVPSWHSRKARTPRGKQQNSGSKSPASGSEEVVKCMSYLVPEVVMSGETTSFEDSDGQLLYGRVPIFDSAILLSSTRPQRVVINAPEMDNENMTSDHTNDGSFRSACFNANEMKGFVGNFYNDVGFIPTDIDLEEFAADVESLLGNGLDNDESFGIDGLGLMMEDVDVFTDTSSVKPCGSRVKDEDEIEMANEAFKLDFDYNDEEKVEVVLKDDETVVVKKRKLLLMLDYESILSTWDESVTWASRTRPDIDLNECWPSCLATCQIESHQQHLADHATCFNGRMGRSGDSGREARVSRYREKRMTRLFSKKIRYEVRKLNAEKRPRMKGRFVKRPSVVS